MTTTPDGGLAAALRVQAAHDDKISLLEEGLALLAERVSEIREKLDGDAGGGVPYRPIPAPRWWSLKGEQREAAINRLRGWVRTVYQPSYGQVAAGLPRCWAHHPFCLFALDWLSELNSVLYLQPGRTTPVLTAQAEWQSRLLPAIAEAMRQECASCPRSGHPGGGHD